VREFYKKQYETWTKQRETSEKGQDEAKVKQRPQSFTDQIAALLTEEDGKSRRRR
jgi:hypothetical protein